MGAAHWQVFSSLRFSSFLLICRPVELLSFCGLKTLEYLPVYGANLRGGYLRIDVEIIRRQSSSCNILIFFALPFLFSNVSSLRPVQSEWRIVYKRGFDFLNHDTSKSYVNVCLETCEVPVFGKIVFYFDFFFLLSHRNL